MMVRVIGLLSNCMSGFLFSKCSLSYKYNALFNILFLWNLRILKEFNDHRNFTGRSREHSFSLC